VSYDDGRTLLFDSLSRPLPAPPGRRDVLTPLFYRHLFFTPLSHRRQRLQLQLDADADDPPEREQW